MNSRELLRFLALPLVVTAACSDDSTDKPAPDAGSNQQPTTADVALVTTGPGAHLQAKDGKTLFFYVPDIAGSKKSACTGACLTAWPAFDAATPTVGDGLTATDFVRFDRGDGSGMQLAWKGRPLYTHSTDSTGTTDGQQNGLWFVARAYNVFFGLSSDAANVVTPFGSTAGKPFLTNGGGRTLYVFGRDTLPTTAGGAPKSGCLANPCFTNWPVWEKGAAVTTVVVPSTLQASDFTVYANPGLDSAGPTTQQFVYKGYPLYFFKADAETPGLAKGVSVAAWYAVDGTFTPPLPTP